MSRKVLNIFRTYFGRKTIRIIIKKTIKNIPRKIWVIYHPIIWRKLHFKKDVEKLLPYFQNKRGIRIGGKLKWEIQRFLRHTAKVIDINIVRFYFGKPIKVDYLADVTNLYFAKDGEFDFVCSSHVLEHIPNPIKAMYEWIRVIKEGGIVYCGVPDMRFSSDHKRKRTPLRHLIDDYEHNVGQHDITHIQEFVENWDESMDWDFNREQFLRNIRRNPSLHAHHHVWVKKDIMNLFKYVGLEIIYLALSGDTIHIIGKKSKLRD